MKILFLTWENFGTEGMKEAFISCGHEVVSLATCQEELLGTAIADKLGPACAAQPPDMVFGFNYFPNVASKASELGIDYYSWVYDNPCVQLYSYTVTLPTNHIFVFDSDTFLEFHSQGIDTIRFLPMAAYPVKDEGQLATTRFDNDITFIGSLYTEKHNFYDRMLERGVSPYTEGYLRGLMEAQKQLYGTGIVESLLTDPVIEDMHKALPLEPASDSVITRRKLFTEYVINRRITAEERGDLLKLLGQSFGNVTLYTPDPGAKIPGCINKGTADPDKETPTIYRSSRINLNISLRSIVNGIPLRCFDIMGAGGFLMTSYAGDFTEFFTAGEDYVFYESPEDLVNKCRYYLEHEEERRQIAAAGYAKVQAAHTYVHRVREMLS